MSRHPLTRRLNVYSRRVHRWGAILASVPVVIILCTGLLLQLKKQVPWVQPPTMRGSSQAPTLEPAAILAAAAAVPEAGISSWADVERLDIQPRRGIAKVVSATRWEVQIDTATGAVLQSRYRRSDLIESIHDGSYFHDKAKLFVFLPAGAALLGLWITGMYLWIIPNLARRNGRRRRGAVSSGGGA